MRYFVYILYSEAYDRFYIGQTADSEDRLRRHNAGTESATRPYRLWVMKLCLEKRSRAEAMVLEGKLKNLSKERIRAFMRKYG